MAAIFTARVQDWLQRNSNLLSNATSMIGSVGITSGLGFAYWWVAARLLPQRTVGLASAAISAMMLLALVGLLGMGTWLMGELPRQPERRGVLIATGLLVASSVALLFGITFAVLGPFISSEFAPLGENLAKISLFAVGVSVTAAGMVVDDAMIGLLRGSVQFQRNAIFAASKLLVLIAVALLVDPAPMMVYSTWTAGNICSFLFLLWMGWRKGVLREFLHPRLDVLQGRKTLAMGHHIMNLTLQGQGFALTLLVTVLLGVKVSASFYLAWMLTSFVFLIPNALTMVLFTVGSANMTVFAENLRLTLRLSALISTAAVLGFLITANLLLSVFGSSYASQAAVSLRILVLGVFPLAIKMHFFAIARIHGRIAPAAKLAALGAGLELIAAAIGAQGMGLAGLCLGWVLAMTFEALLFAPLVYETAITRRSPLRWGGEVLMLGLGK